MKDERKRTEGERYEDVFEEELRENLRKRIGWVFKLELGH